MIIKKLVLLFLLLSSSAFVAADEEKNSLLKSLSNGVTNITGDINAEPLSAEKAFTYTLSADKELLTASWRVTPEHYLYKNRIKFIIKSPDGAILNSPIFPPSKTKTDITGTHQVFDHDFKVQIPIKKGNANNVIIETRYQGCSDAFKICYPPQKKTHKLTFSSDNTGNVKVVAVTNSKSPIPPIKPIKEKKQLKPQVTGKCEATTTEQNEVLSQLTNASTIGAIFIFFLIGLGLAFTPCIYPMIPILSSIIVGQGTQVSTRKAFVLSLAYVLPMAMIYALAGYFIGNSGESLQAMFQNPWILSSFAFVFVLLSLSMFGFYDLQMPASIQNKLTNISNSQESGSIIGAAIMGALSALIVGPCVTAPLIAAFTYIAEKGSSFLGMIDMLALGLGIGLPLLLIGTSAGQLLPRAGAWMETTKAVFGVMMLGLAISMLERILPSSITMSLAAILLIVTAIYMGALDPIEKASAKRDSIMSSLNPVEKAAGRWRSMWKALGFIALTYGIMLMIGAAAGKGNLYQPLSGVFANASQEQHEIQFQKIKGIDGLKAALASAKQQKRPVMLDFSADWCSYCKVMERTTFADKDVLDSFENTLFLQADITNRDKADQSLLKSLGVMATPPMIFFFDSNGIEQKDYRLAGEITAEKLAEHAKNFMNCFRVSEQ
jgi:thiol:disulfide interchange protein DsbD